MSPSSVVWASGLPASFEVPDSLADRGAPAGRWNRVEDALSAIALTGMVLLPLAEIAGRRLVGRGVPGSVDYVRHLTLWLTLLGAMGAARNGRHLALTTTAWMPASWRWMADVAAAAVACAVCGALAWTSWQLVLAERTSAMTLAGGVPIYLAQAILPIGFAIIAWRVACRAPGVTGRVMSAAALGAVAWLGVAPLPILAALRWPLVGILGAAMMLGSPIFVVLAGLGLVLFLTSGGPLAAVPTEIYNIVASSTLPTIPLFTLAGALLARGGTPARLVRLFQAAAGWLPGGTAVAAVLVCAFFTTFSGASAVTILALGGLLFPVLVADGFTPRFSVGLLTAAGSVGLLFPPSLPVILYGVTARTPIDEMFLACLVPGLVLVLFVCLYCVREGWRAGSRLSKPSARAIATALWDARWEVLLPIVVLASVFGGFATLVEAAALTALYAVVTKCVLQRDVSMVRDVPRVLSDSAILVGGSLIVLGASLGLTSYLVDIEAPALAAAWVRSGIQSRGVFLLTLNIFLLAIGCPMDILSATVAIVPLLVPVAAAFGVNPLHLGVIFLTNLELGGLTPPVGMNLFLASYTFNQSMMQVTRAIMPFLLVQLLGVLLVTYWPALSVGIVAYFR